MTTRKMVNSPDKLTRMDLNENTKISSRMSKMQKQ